MKTYRKQIGWIFGMELSVEAKKKSQKQFNEHCELAKRALSGIQYIYFNDYEGGHHPDFFKKHPELTTL